MVHINDGCSTEVLSLPFGSLSAIKLVYEAHKSLQNGYSNTQPLLWTVETAKSVLKLSCDIEYCF